MPAYVSTIAEQLQRLLLARNWPCSASRFTVEAVEPALEPMKHVWMAGLASAIPDGEVKAVRPSRVVVPDQTTRAEIARLEAAMEAAGRRPLVETFTRFVDFLWDGAAAADRARRDAELYDAFDEVVPARGRPTPDSRHVPQAVRLGNDAISDYRLLDRALASEGTWLAVLADAGLGKSELLQWHEWRSAVQYQSFSSQRTPNLPAIALRVPLRGLRSLSLDAVAHYLSRPDEDNDLPALPRIDTGRFLLELLRLHRLVLLLDGVDELLISSDKLEDGLRELQRAVSDGGRMVLSARLGHLLSGRSISARFRAQEVATIEPMPPGAGEELLVRHGAESDEAKAIIRRLTPSPASGIPLFLLLAHSVELSSELPQEVLASRTQVLLELLRLFCKRDESRLGVSMAEQMELLTSLAHWMSLEGELEESEALELLGIDRIDASAAIIVNPHALLTKAGDGELKFKYPQFFALFAAKALADDWSTLGINSILDDLRGRKLEDATAEYLSRLVQSRQITEAWELVSSRGDLRKFPLLRRNILALALAALEDRVQGANPAARSAHLAELLGSRDLLDISLAGLALVRLDLAGWSLLRIRGRGGALNYCTGLAGASYDESLESLDSHEGTELPKDVPIRDRIAAGAERLARLLWPVRRKGSTGLVGVITQEECRDAEGWTELRRLGLADLRRKGPGGQRTWRLKSNGIRLLGAFLRATEDEGLSVDDFRKREPAIESVLLALGD